MEKYLTYVRTLCFLVITTSFVVIAYSQYEGMKAQRIQAVAAVMARDEFVRVVSSPVSIRLINAGFSIQEVYEYLYGADLLVKKTQD